MRSAGYNRDMATQSKALGRTPRGSTSGATSSPLLAALVVAAVAVLTGALITAGKKTSDGSGVPDHERLQAAKTKPDPFGRDGQTVPDAAPAAPGGGPEDRYYDASPEDLFDTPLWVRAKELASTADSLRDKAEAALAEGNNDLYLRWAVAARQGYEAAMAEAADWELDIKNEYGEFDNKVRVVIKTITRWNKGFQKYRKLRDPSQQ